MSRRLNIFIFSAFVILTAFIAKAENLNLQVPIQKADPNASTDQKLGTGFLASGIEFIQKVLPDKYSCASKIYAKTLGLEAYQSVYHMGKTNAGITGYFENELSQNSCFAAVADQFVEKIKAKDDAENILGNFSDLQEVSGQGRYKNYPPGWAWQQALETTNGDKNAAMMLIGLCGHEEEPAYAYEISGKNKVLLAKKDLAGLETNLKDLKMRLKTIPASNTNEREAIDGYIRRVQSDIEKSQNSIANLNTTEKRTLYCPANSSGFIAPKSLGPTVDIPEELKNKIRRVQRPGGTNYDTLKSKYYHVTGSALLGCQMAKCGVTPETSAKIEEKIAGQYRAIRLCGLVSSNLKNMEALSKKIKVSVDDEKFTEKANAYLKGEVKSLIGEENAKNAQIRSLMAQGFSGKDVFDRLTPRRCDHVSEEADPLLNYLCILAYDEASKLSTSAETDQRNATLLREYDSSRLYRKWYVGGGRPLGFDLPCTDMRFRGPDNLEEEKPNCGMDGWSQERCSGAIKKLATWDVDFEWTKKQHEIGSNFGASQCQKQNTDEKLDKSFCKILKENSDKEALGTIDNRSNKAPRENPGAQ